MTGPFAVGQNSGSSRGRTEADCGAEKFRQERETAMSAPDGSPVGAERSIGQLFASATTEMSALVHDEIALAKAQLKQEIKPQSQRTMADMIRPQSTTSAHLSCCWTAERSRSHVSGTT